MRGATRSFTLAFLYAGVMGLMPGLSAAQDSPAPAASAASPIVVPLPATPPAASTSAASTSAGSMSPAMSSSATIPAPAASSPVTPSAAQQIDDERCRSGTETVAFAPQLPRVRERLARGEPLTIVALGSSTTAGSGASNYNASYPAVLEELLEAAIPQARPRVINQGIGGQRAKDMLMRLDADVLPHKPALVIWQTGVNDAIHDIGVDALRKHLRKGISRVRDAGSDIMMIGAQWLPRPERFPHYDLYRQAMSEVAAETQVPLFRRYDTMVAWSRAGKLSQSDILGMDGLHMVDASYRCLAVLIADGIVKALRTPPVAATR